MSPLPIALLPIEDRPRERLLARGADALSDVELLAVLLAPGGRGASATELAARLLADFADLAGIADAPAAELARALGMGEARATRVVAALALGRRALGARAQLLGRPLRSAADVYAWARPHLAGRRQETFVALALDARHRVMRVIEIAVGSLAGVEVHPREVFRPLIREAAAATLVVHNHPSGDPLPSQDDVELTARLREAGSLVGIPLLDHVVVGAEGYVSLAERGLL